MIHWAPLLGGVSHYNFLRRNNRASGYVNLFEVEPQSFEARMMVLNDQISPLPVAQYRILKVEDADKQQET